MQLRLPGIKLHIIQENGNTEWMGDAGKMGGQGQE